MQGGAAERLGAGFGGFVDGIVLHQLLQWHHMVSDNVNAQSLGGLEDNTLADGIFHSVTWLITFAGSLAVVRAWRRGELAPQWSVHIGGLLVGWGVFNVMDSANHFVFGLHHVRDDLGGPIGWDIGFLVFAIGLVAVGSVLVVRNDHGALARPSPNAR